MSKLKHAWPTDTPIQKKPRVCGNCDLAAHWMKLDSYTNRWGIWWGRDGRSGEVGTLRDLPECTGAAS